ncbi:MAG: HAMP domain-containing protein [Spirochaetales bacterium]|nr:HAMP domain-containing protein [Spirochaetales bacterium]
MKIKAKLLTLIISMIVAMTLSLVIYMGFNTVIKTIEKEKSILQDYRNALMESHKELLRFNLDAFVIVDQMKIFNKSLEAKNVYFEKIKDIKILPSLNKNIETAIKNISNLEDYQSDGLTKFYGSTDTLLESVREIMGSDAKYILNGITETSMGFTDQEVSKLRFYGKKMKKELYYLEVGMQTSVDIINEQYFIIDNQSKIFEKMGNILTLGFFILILVTSIIISSIITGKIVKSISRIGTSLSVMASNDLSHEIVVNSHDELGDLGGEMNKFQNELNVSLNRIKSFSNKNEEIKNFLINTATETASASVEIAANIESVDQQMNTLNNNILDSNKKVGYIASFTNELNNHIADQMAMVEESTASITEMIASISSVASLTERNRNVMGKLQDTAKDGDTQITETTDIIEDINSSMHNIGAMAEVIQSISDQTNLLAMNAAIEAAHAGDAGKGFAVVADEIRKLSEASAQSSKDISKNLKDIVKKFEKASVSGINTRESFTKIYENIQNISDSLIAVSSSTAELNIGGKQILEAMDSLRDISMEVQEKSEEMMQSAVSVQSSFGQLSDISSVVTEAMSEVSVGFNEVKDSVNGIEEISTQVGEISRDLNTECNKFKTV